MKDTILYSNYIEIPSVHKIKRKKGRKEIKFIWEQINVIYKQDPSVHSFWEAILTPGFRAIIYYKIAHYFYQKNCFFRARWISKRKKNKLA